jgi:hypothetical protein
MFGDLLKSSIAIIDTTTEIITITFVVGSPKAPKYRPLIPIRGAQFPTNLSIDQLIIPIGYPITRKLLKSLYAR